MMPSHLRESILAMALLSLTGCASAPQEARVVEDPTIAQIEVVDRRNYKDELYRYVAWQGEHYGPTAFEGAARGKVKSLVLVNPNEAGIRCVAALAGALSASATLIDPVSGLSKDVTPTSEKVNPACEIPYDVPRPQLASQQYYVVAGDVGVAIDGEPYGSPRGLVARLIALNASAIVIRKATIAQMLCFGAIATEANVHILEVNRDGSLSGMRVSGQSLADSCAW